MKKITLILPRFKYPSGDYSLGLAYIGSYLKKNIKDLKISLIDATYHPNFKYIKGKLQKFKPDITGIYVDTLMFEDAIKVAKICKEFNINVIFGGPHPTIMPESTIKIKEVDAICIGEGEVPFKEYVEEFYKKKEFKKVRGIWFKKDKKIIKNLPQLVIKKLDKIPFPAIELYEIENYIQNFIQLDSYKPNLRGLGIIASRGCPFQCSYCQPTLKCIFGAKLRIRSPRNVVDEIKIIKKMYKLDAIYFQDDTLTAFKKWMNEFCEILIKEKVGIIWACNTRADTYDLKMLKIMKKAGLVKLKVGIESITDRIRNGIYKKNVSKEQINNLIKDANKVGIQVAGFFMLGAPTETIKEIKDTIKFAVNSNLMEANFSITTPLPKTTLWDLAKEKGWKTPKRFSDYDYYKAVRPSMAKEDIKKDKLERLRKIAVLLFFLHPKRSIKIILSLFTSTGIKRLLLKLKRF